MIAAPTTYWACPLIAAANEPARIAIVMGQPRHQSVHACGPLMLALPEALAKARDYVVGLSTPNAYPARNSALRRKTTPEEKAFLRPNPDGF